MDSMELRPRAAKRGSTSQPARPSLAATSAASAATSAHSLSRVAISPTAAQATATVLPAAKRRKTARAVATAPAQAFDDAAAYSDSDDEAVTAGNKQAKKHGLTGTGAVFNYTKHGRGAFRPGVIGVKKVDNIVQPMDLEVARAALESDARELHSLVPGKRPGATTITTSLMHKPKTGTYRRFVHINTKLMPPKIRKRAEKMGYHVVKAAQAHAEGEKIQYDAARKGVYEHEDMATDKPHCAECETAMKNIYGPKVKTQTTYSGKTFTHWHNPEPLQDALGLPSAATATRDVNGNLLEPRPSAGKGKKRKRDDDDD
jgi:hypothetical protein